MNPHRNYHIDTLAIRAGTERSQFGEHSEAMYLTSSFLQDSAYQAAERFANREAGNTYSRFTNPSTSMLQKRIAALEGGEDCLVFATGMAAQLALFMAHLNAGDHVLCSQGVFGSTIQLFNTVLARFGVSADYVPMTNSAAWAAAVKPNTKLFFLETPSNPLVEVGDIAAISAVAKSCGALMVVDNCFCSPALQQPLKFGADIVTHSATKYIDGQGRVMGGAVVGKQEFIQGKLLPMLRTAGATLSPFNAWVLLKGLETLSIRMDKHSSNALALGQWLETQPMIERVCYPFLPSHPQYALAKKQQSAGSGTLSISVRGDTPEAKRRNAWAVIDAVQLMSVTTNLGDSRTTISHPATTSHGRLTPEQRALAGIDEGMIRISVGLEHIEDLKTDLLDGLALVQY